jgi:hypothetical protein
MRVYSIAKGPSPISEYSTLVLDEIAGHVLKDLR